MSERPRVPPADLAHFVAGECGPVAAWRNESWDHGESDVWRAELASETTSGQAVIVKRHRQPAKFAQERAAYEHWAPAVGMCPKMLAAEGGYLRAIILEAVPGSPLLVTELRPAQEAEHYASAGRWLRRLHDLPWEDSDSLDVAAALTKRSATWSQRARALSASPLSEAIIETVHARVSAPWPTGATVPARVPCHRDYTARNWLVEDATFSVIDFEHSRADWSLTDVERVASSIPEDRSELWTAFEAGYGRPLGPAEQGLLQRLQLHAALSRVVWAVEHQDAAFEKSGLEQLDRLLS